nr:hypothetical protein [Halomicrobium urmianum]
MDRIRIRTSDAERLAEGYRRRAERDAAVADELRGLSREANGSLGDAPEW